MTQEEAVEKLKRARDALAAAGHNCGKARGNTNGWKNEGAYQTAAHALERVYSEVKDFLPADMPIVLPLRAKHKRRGKAPQR